MQETTHESFERPEETREFPNGEAQIVSTGGAQVGRMIFQYHGLGRLAIRMDNGTEIVAGPGDVTSLPSGHDAWVVGDEPAVVVDWYGASNDAKAS